MDGRLLLKIKPKKQQEKIRLVTQFNPRSPTFNKILHQYQGLLLMTRKINNQARRHTGNLLQKYKL